MVVNVIKCAIKSQTLIAESRRDSYDSQIWNIRETVVLCTERDNYRFRWKQETVHLENKIIYTVSGI